MSLPNAAEQLVRQVTDRDADAAYTVDNLDGFELYRTITFGPETSEWLADVLDAIDDERIESWEQIDDGIVVNFVGDIRADDPEPYAFDEALTILDEDSSAD